MKNSDYNYLLRNDKGEAFLVNPLYNGIVRIDKWLLDIWEKNKNDLTYFRENHSRFYDCLKKRHFIINNEENEVASCLSQIRHNYEWNDGCLYITINPTLDCNLRCWYCYEEHRKGSLMNTEVIDAILCFIKESIKKNHWEEIHLSFFGGEPFLGYKQVILPLLRSIKEICDENQIGCSHGYTTNATLLTVSRIKELQKISPNLHFQITFDGNEIYHNQTKYFGNGRGSYKRALQNTRLLIQSSINVSIRLNLTNTNIGSMKETVLSFSDLVHYHCFTFQIQKVWQEKETPLLRKELPQLIEVIKSIGIGMNNEEKGYYRARCYANFRHNLVINYNGDIFQCTARDFSKENRMGILLSDGEILYNEGYIVRQEKQIKDECLSCILLPICPMCSQRKYEISTCCSYRNNPQSILENLKGYFKIYD